MTTITEQTLPASPVNAVLGDVPLSDAVPKHGPSRIRRLDPHVINRIAAGEVIERPASIIKELLENSLDALAGRVEVDVEKGGVDLIRVVDDGEGVASDDLPLALASHATSKIQSDADLFKVQTLGFRGEALASIAAVSRLRIRSRTPEAGSGWEIESEFGRISEPASCGAPLGTSVDVRQLFANTPVRRKFLKTQATEFGHISEQFTRIVLAHPRLSGVLRHNGKVVYDLPASERLIQRLELFYGAELAESLIPIEAGVGDVRLWGYAAHPSQSKSTRKGQYLFLNGRWIQDRALGHALQEAYRGLLMVGRHPVAFLFLETPADAVDVNVHPTKSEVRFRDAQSLYRLLLSTLRTKFLGMNLDSKVRLPDGGPNGGRDADRSADSGGDEFAARPVDPEERAKVQRELVSWATSGFNRWTPGEASETDAAPEGRILSGEEAAARLEELRAQGFSPDADMDEEDDRDRGLEGWAFEAAYDLPSAAPGVSSGDESSEDAAPDQQPDGVVAVNRASDASADDVSAGAYRETDRPSAAARVMQVHDCYLVLETDEGLTVVDQHALHERILYEHLRRRVLAGRVESQRILVPESIELSPREAALLIENRDLLLQLGYEVEEFGRSTVLMSAYPAMLRRADHPGLIRDIAERLSEEGAKPTRRDLLDGLLHMMSCKAAVKAGQRLTPPEMDSLLAQRRLVDDAHHCPHGRPTALVLSREELDRQFGRLGAG